MKFFFGSKISDNITETPEGYLICHNVNLARTGVQQYKRSEIGLDGNPNELVNVYRLPEEVSSKATLASFEGKTFTNNHPYKLIDINDSKIYDVGDVVNIRWEDPFIVGDIIVKDPQAATNIQNGKREISAGYSCLWEPYKDGYTQRNIRGNHVALVDKGRAGEEVAIKDESPVNNVSTTKGEKLKMSQKDQKKGIIGRMLSAFAKDAEPDELLAAMDCIAKDEEPETPPKKEEVKDEGSDVAIQALLKRVDALEKGEKGEVKDEDPLEKLEKEISDEEPEKKEEPKKEGSEVVSDEEPDDAEKKEAAKKAVADAKILVAKISNPAERKAVADAFANIIRGQISNSNYSTIKKAASKVNDKAVTDAATQRETLVQEKFNNMKKLSAQYKGEK